MAIERKTPTIGLDILETGTKDWGSFQNNNLDLIDAAITADRGRITALETTSAVLPVALASRVGHNLLRNNVFGLGLVSSPESPTSWTTQFLNGAIGNYTRTSQTFLVGTHSLRISIASVDTSPSSQTRPFPGLNIKDPETQAPIGSTDPRQLTNGFGYSFQTVTLSPSTTYTLSSYGKAEISNPGLGINVQWKIGIVFKAADNSIIESYFSSPQVNKTPNLETSSFKRVELTFETPNLPVVTAEVWLVTEGSIPSGIGSAWFDGVQLEQSTSAAGLDLFSLNGGDLTVDGNLIVGGSLTLQQQDLIFDSDQVTFTGDVQIGDDINEDTLTVFTKSSTFNSPVVINGSVSLGSDPISHLVDVKANKTTFSDNGDALSPQGGDVEIQGELVVKGNTTLGDNSTEDSVTINAQMVSIANDVAIANDLDVDGFLDVERGVVLGSNNPASPFDTLRVKMKDGGSFFDGYVQLEDGLFVKGDVTLGDANTDLVTVNAGSTLLKGSLSVTNAFSVTGASTFVTGTGNNFTVITDDFSVTANNNASINSDYLDISGSVSIGSGGETATIDGYQTTFGTSTAKYNQFNVYSQSSSFSDDLSIGGDLTSAGNNFIFGNLLSLTSSGDLTIGDQTAITSDTYDNNLRVYAGTTFFGDFGSQTKGNVEVGGDLKAAGNITLGSSTAEDLVQVTANQINVNVGSGYFNIGAGFQNNPYNPAITDHGGLTADNNGNLSLDGKLTVKGPFDPTQVIINPQLATGSNVADALIVNSAASTPNTTTRLSSEGELDLSSRLRINDGYVTSIDETAATFGTSLVPLQSFDVDAQTITLTGSTTVDGDLSAGIINCLDLEADGNVGVNGALTVRDSIISNGTVFSFGGAPNLSTSFNVKANTILLGVDGYNIGNVTVGNNLTVRNDFQIGTKAVDDNYTNLASIHAEVVDIHVSSELSGGTSGTELKGFRIGGGFQDNPFNDGVQDHGGVTIDAYGNIFADGSITQKGAFGFDSLILTVPTGGDPTNLVLEIIDNSAALGDTNFTIDGYGNLATDGHVSSLDLSVESQVCIDGTNISGNEDGTFLGAASGQLSKLLFKVDNTSAPILPGHSLDIDNLGNLRTDGYLVTEIPGRSNLATATCTVGDGKFTFGDFNLTGPFNQFTDPITEAINYINSSANGNGVIYVKSGTYPVPSSGYLIPAGVTIIGEGSSTILDGTANSPSLAITLAENASAKNLTVESCPTGIQAVAANCNIENVIIINGGLGLALLGNNANVTSCRITQNTDGVSISGDENIVNGNHITDNTVSGITLTGNDNIVTNNIVKRNP